MDKAFNSIVIFADGASTGNPGPGGWGAIIVTPDGHVTELGGGERQTTNNRMELMAVIRALDFVSRKTGPVGVYTDSSYVINGITGWIWAWRKNNWKTSEGGDVANSELWKVLFASVMKRGKDNPIGWNYVRGHSGIPGNERTDEIAVSFSKRRSIDLYEGPLLKYQVAVFDIPEDTSVPKPKPKQEPKPKAFSYLSLVGGELMRHATWEECERRVKGRSGAKFKKAVSSEDETKIISSWGLKPSDLKSS